MLAATHWLNAALHWQGASPDTEDVLHTYMLTVNDFRRLSVHAGEAMRCMAEIEDMRPFHVRGDADGRPQAAARAIQLCKVISDIALQAEARALGRRG